MQHNFSLSKPYGLANQNLCYILIDKSWRKAQRMFLRMVGEYGPYKNMRLNYLSEFKINVLDSAVSILKSVINMLRFLTARVSFKPCAARGDIVTSCGQCRLRSDCTKRAI